MLALLLLSTFLGQDPSPGCVAPLSALDIGRALGRQNVGHAWHAAPAPNQEATAARSDQAVVMTFGCRGDYVDELDAEDLDGDRNARFHIGPGDGDRRFPAHTDGPGGRYRPDDIGQFAVMLSIRTPNVVNTGPPPRGNTTPFPSCSRCTHRRSPGNPPSH